jgi:hypothetical protein
MTDSSRSESRPAESLPRQIAGPLAGYAERLLLSTDLTLQDALRIASGEQEPPSELRVIGKALRASWSLHDSSEGARP